MTNNPQKVIMKIYHQKRTHKWTVNKWKINTINLKKYNINDNHVTIQ
jgi:hypothetical protein